MPIFPRIKALKVKGRLGESPQRIGLIDNPKCGTNNRVTLTDRLATERTDLCAIDDESHTRPLYPYLHPASATGAHD